MSDRESESRWPKRLLPHAIGLCAALAIVAATGWLAGIEAPPGAEAVSVEPVARPAAAAVRDNASTNFIGVSGCTAAACHGGPVSPDPRLQWQSSYTIWASPEPRGAAPDGKPDHSPLGGGQLVDKHNRAYAVLFDERSKRIVQLLDHLPDVKSAAPQRDARCTVCHSAPVDPKAAPVSILADGVSCELCHGAAKNWLREHTQIAWLAGYHAGKPEPLSDMKDTRNLLSRAQICASCHVGDAALGRDVNHDLIAAGHPRLNFQFHAYLGVMPKHWSDAPGSKVGFRTDRETNAEAWAIGQLVSAEAALQLLAARAAAAGRVPGAAGASPSAPWPEFAEYGCYACHHQLSDKRATLREKTLEASDQRPAANSLPWSWGTWYFPNAELRLVLEEFPFSESPEVKRAIELIVILKTEMATVHPRTGAIVNTATEAADILSHVAMRLSRSGLDTRKIDDFLKRAADEHFAPCDWDGAAQRLLTLDALWKAYQFAHPRINANDSAAVSATLDGLRKLLEFPHAAKEAVGNAKQVAVRVDSPANYDPEAVRAQFNVVFDAVKKLFGSERP